jgi:hypothetical protein
MARTAKQAAPPPPTGFTGEVPRPSVGQKVSDHIRKRRAERRARPRVPLVVVHNTPAAPKRRRSTRISRNASVLGLGSQPRARRARRRPARRGTLFAVFSVVVASVVLTAAVVEFVSWTAATGVFAAAEGVSFGTAWFFGDPNPPAKQPPTPRKPRAAGNPPPKSGGHRCGAPTEDGSACNNPVATAGEKCWRHPGGAPASGTGPKPKAGPRAKPAGPKKTRKAAPPPTHNLGNTGA